MAISIGVIVNKGFERAAVVQIRELIERPKDMVVEDTIVLFSINDWDNIYRFIYRNQISNRVIYFMDKFEYSDDEELLTKLSKKFSKDFDDELLKKLISSGADFRVSLRTDEHTDVTWLEAEVGGVLIDYAKMHGHDMKVNLKNPIVNFYIHVNNGTAYLGIDLSGDLSKREYKIFNNAVSLKGPTAFGLLMLANYKSKDVYLNPCCYSGTLEIEAALYATSSSHRFYSKSFPFMKFSDNDGVDWDKFFKKIDDERMTDKKDMIFSITGSDKLLSSISAATKNAKIAGVESMIDFRRVDLDWMDIKYEEASIDKIISFIPGSSKHDKNLVKDFKQIFYQAEYILKKSGKLVIMCLSKDLLIQSSSEYFDVDHEVTVHSGSQAMHVLFFKRKDMNIKG
jgi:23S rRNA G2445 N2-methylase RlmL